MADRYPTIERARRERTNVYRGSARDAYGDDGAGATRRAASADIARKDARLPANYFTAKATIRDSKLKAEWVDIPLEGETVKLHTLVVYPSGTAKTGLVVVMQHGVGVDEWQGALADQVAEDGFSAVLPDLWSGTGPNGGNWDASEFVDDAVRNAAGKVSPDDGMKRYKIARDWALKLPRANGNSASIGFCMGGGNSFRFATEVPEVNGAVVYYGGAPTEAQMTSIQAPVRRRPPRNVRYQCFDNTHGLGMMAPAAHPRFTG